MKDKTLPEPTEWDFNCMAWHEAGHATCSMFLAGRPPIERVSITPGDDAYGFMRTSPGNRLNSTRESLVYDIAVELSGIVSERLFLGLVTTSGGSDLCAAYSIAHGMVVRFGMGSTVGFACPGFAPERQVSAFFSRNAAKVESDIAEIIGTAQRIAEENLATNASTVRDIANALLQKRTLDGNALMEILKRGDLTARP